MSIEDTPISTEAAYGILLMLFILGLVLLTAPINFFIYMIDEIRSQADFVYLYKGVYYLFGGGLVFLLLVAGLLYPRIFKKPMKAIWEKILFSILVASLVLYITALKVICW